MAGPFHPTSRSARSQGQRRGSPLGGPTEVRAQPAIHPIAAPTSAASHEAPLLRDLEFCFRRVISSGRISRKRWAQVREDIRRSEADFLVGEPMIEDTLPPLDILSAWAPHRRITVSWAGLVRFFDGHIPNDRLSFRRALRVGTKAATTSMVRRCIGSFFVPLQLYSDHPVVASSVEAVFLTEMHVWLFALLGTGDVGLDFISDLHDRTRSFDDNLKMVDGHLRDDVQLAWELTAASGRFHDPDDLWIILKQSSIEAARSLGTAQNLLAGGLADRIGTLPELPNEIQDWWPPSGMYLRELKTLRFFSSVLAAPRAGREVPPDPNMSIRVSRLISAIRFEKLVVTLRSIQDEMSLRQRVPVIPDRTIRQITQSCQYFLSDDRRWSWMPGSLGPARLLAALNGARAISSSSHVSTVPILSGAALRFVRLGSLPGFVSSPVPSMARAPPMSRAERETTTALPCVAALKSPTAKEPSIDPGSSSRRDTTVAESTTVSLQGVDVPSVDSVVESPLYVGPASKRRTLLTPDMAQKYCLRTADLLAAYPDLGLALTNLDLTKSEYVNLREVLQGASGTIRVAEGKDPGRLRAARGGSTGTVQSRRNAALELENHELRDRVARLRDRLDVALDQVGRLGALALEVGARDGRYARDDSPDNRALKRQRRLPE